MYQGSYTALVTPFHADGTFDEPAFRRLVDFQFEQGITGIIPVGTTGESPTLSYEEHKHVIRVAVEQTRGRGPVIGGTGANSTDEAIELTASAEAAGCEAVLQVAPYYNKPSAEGLFQHFKKVAESTKCKIVLYSVPSRCGIDIPVEVTVRLAAACPNVVCLKEAGGSVERVNQLMAAVPKSFTLLSGDDSLTLPFMAVGAKGVISVAGNLIPQSISQLVKLALAENYTEARALHLKLYPLMSTLMKLDSNPVPIKAAMALAGHMQSGLRLPMTELDAEKVEDLRAVLKQYQLL